MTHPILPSPENTHMYKGHAYQINTSTVFFLLMVFLYFSFTFLPYKPFLAGIKPWTIPCHCLSKTWMQGDSQISGKSKIKGLIYVHICQTEWMWDLTFKSKRSQPLGKVRGYRQNQPPRKVFFPPGSYTAL